MMKKGISKEIGKWSEESSFQVCGFEMSATFFETTKSRKEGLPRGGIVVGLSMKLMSQRLSSQSFKRFNPLRSFFTLFHARFFALKSPAMTKGPGRDTSF